jgi:SAM-dependent methyltransferase
MKEVKGKDGFVGIRFLPHFAREIMQPGLHPVDIIGGGCMLFKTDVFRKLTQPYFWVDGIVGTDVSICERLRAAGVPVYIDTTIELGHIGEPVVVNSRTVPRYSKTLGEVNQALWEDLREYYQMDNDQLESAMIRASEGDARAEVWDSQPRDTWEQVHAYYAPTNEQARMQQVLNLARYNLEYDAAREYVVNELDRLVKPGGHVIDYGAGLGYCAIPLVEKHRQRVTIVDLEEAATLDFLRWRVARRGPEVEGMVRFGLLGEAYPVLPFSWLDRADGCLLISVLDHLTHPYETLEWISAQVKPGGFLICDTWQNRPKPSEPQHLCRYDPPKLLAWLISKGWELAPERHFLFLKR